MDSSYIPAIITGVVGIAGRLKMREDAVLEKFPLFCPKCKQETLINVRQMNMSVIREPYAKTQSR